MGHHAKTNTTFVCIILLFVGALFYSGGTGPRGPWLLYLLGIGSWMVAGLALGWVVYSHFRPDRAPDLLRKISALPFERSGICFTVQVEKIDGVAWLTVYFQNRYSRPCIPAIRLVPQRVRWHIEAIEFAADGAEFGRFRRAVNIPSDLLGQTIVVQVFAKNHFPEGRGKMVRFRDGLVVGKLSQGALYALGIAAAAVGQIHVSRAASLNVELPSEASTVDSSAIGDTIECLWRPELGQG